MSRCWTAAQSTAQARRGRADQAAASMADRSTLVRGMGPLSMSDGEKRRELCTFTQRGQAALESPATTTCTLSGAKPVTPQDAKALRPAKAAGLPGSSTTTQSRCMPSTRRCAGRPPGAQNTATAEPRLRPVLVPCRSRCDPAAFWSGRRAAARPAPRARQVRRADGRQRLHGHVERGRVRSWRLRCCGRRAGATAFAALWMTCRGLWTTGRQLSCPATLFDHGRSMARGGSNN